jgi:hypothetical protein
VEEREGGRGEKEIMERERETGSGSTCVGLSRALVSPNPS